MKKLVNKKSKRSSHEMKFKYAFGFFVLLVGSLFGIVFYYDLDPSLLLKLSFYENLANPSMRIVKVQEGLRKEEIANILFKKLDWGEGEKDNFIGTHLASEKINEEGRYFPQTYLLHKDNTPEEVKNIMFEEFSKKVNKIKKPKSAQIINEDTAIKIASIIQREAAGKRDMKLISGIIWNRIWDGMKLQIDATLQYAKGSEEEGWWRKVNPEDKEIDSFYNTYKHKGLPPYPIANPGIDAIEAAFNPEKTDCMFYLHDRDRNIHCAVTYEQHKKNIRKYY